MLSSKDLDLDIERRLEFGRGKFKRNERLRVLPWISEGYFSSSAPRVLVCAESAYKDDGFYRCHTFNTESAAIAIFEAVRWELGKKDYKPSYRTTGLFRHNLFYYLTGMRTKNLDKDTIFRLWDTQPWCFWELVQEVLEPQQKRCPDSAQWKPGWEALAELLAQLGQLGRLPDVILGLGYRMEEGLRNSGADMDRLRACVIFVVHPSAPHTKRIKPRFEKDQRLLRKYIPSLRFAEQAAAAN